LPKRTNNLPSPSRPFCKSSEQLDRDKSTFSKNVGFLVGQRSTFPKNDALTPKSPSSVHFKLFANVVNSEVLFSKLDVSTSLTDQFLLILTRSPSCDDVFFVKRDLSTSSKSLFGSQIGVRKGSEKCLSGHTAERRSQPMSILKDNDWNTKRQLVTSIEPSTNGMNRVNQRTGEEYAKSHEVNQFVLGVVNACGPMSGLMSRRARERLSAQWVITKPR
jgi:hypothetical protein